MKLAVTETLHLVYQWFANLTSAPIEGMVDEIQQLLSRRKISPNSVLIILKLCLYSSSIQRRLGMLHPNNPALAQKIRNVTFIDNLYLKQIRHFGANQCSKIKGIIVKFNYYPHQSLAWLLTSSPEKCQ